MKAKHPLPSKPQPPPSESEVPPKAFSGSDVASAALSFHKGTAPGPSGMRPEHLKSILKGKAPALIEKATVALTKIVNTMAAGKVPQAGRPYMCGARLQAGIKKDSSLRPIAVGNLMRRLVAKCFSSALAPRAAALLSPHQLGVAIQGGAETIAHSVKQAVQEDPGRWVLQADLVNAFNSVDRGAVIEEVARHFPEALAWVVTCYGASSFLRFGDTDIESKTGLHQGCPIAGSNLRESRFSRILENFF